MQTWKCNFDKVTLIGTGCNRQPFDNEVSYDIPTFECAWFNVYPERYQWNGVGIEEIPGYMEAKEKEDAFNKKKAELLEQRKFLNNTAPFMADGVKYVNDESNIQGVKVQILDKPTTDPLPTFVGTPVAGTWRTFDNTYTPFTNGTFISLLCETYFTMRSHNFTNHGLLEADLTTLYNDPVSTVADIEAFDVTVGWSTASVVE